LQVDIRKLGICLDIDPRDIFDFQNCFRGSFRQQLISHLQNDVGRGIQLALLFADNRQHDQVEILAQARMLQRIAGQRRAGRDAQFSQVSAQAKCIGQGFRGGAFRDQALTDELHIEQTHYHYRYAHRRQLEHPDRRLTGLRDQTLITTFVKY
jgi:hypothetical protein